MDYFGKTNRFLGQKQWILIDYNGNIIHFVVQISQV